MAIALRRLFALLLLGGSSGACGHGAIRWTGHQDRCLGSAAPVQSRGSLQLWPCGSQAAGRVEEAGPSLRLVLQGTELCVEVEGAGAAANGRRVRLGSCEPGSVRQSFAAEPAVSGTRLRWLGDDGTKCLDVAGGSPSEGAAVFLWECQSGNPHQSFSLGNSTTTEDSCHGDEGDVIGWPAASPPGREVGGTAWCRIAEPPPNWSLKAAAPSAAGGVGPTVRVLSYNLFWWNLFGRRRGNGGSAGRLIAEAAATAAFDVMAFQECDDAARVLRDAGLAAGGEYATFNGGKALAVTYLAARWELLASGREDVAEDARVPGQYYGRRAVAWVRLRHRTSGRTLFFANHHGPLPVGSGGACGGEAVALRLLRLVALSARRRDALVVAGDFNAGATSDTLQALGRRLHLLHTGRAFGGVDNVLSSLGEGAVLAREILGSGGSDHDAIAVTLRL
jgi:endonuclease/exonuclease/phosphatase family metal-dependent hydrolase